MQKTAFPASPQLFLSLLLLLILPSPLLGQSPEFQCQEISIAMCRNIGYNVTLMPNQFHHDTQEEAGLEVHQYWPLVGVGCSRDLQFFLCATYVPICLPGLGRTLPVCRELCLRARAGCEPLMRGVRMSWPDRLHCDRLPRYGDTDRLCMDNRNGELPGPPEQERCACRCRPPRVVSISPNHRLYNRSVAVGGVPHCALPCQPALFTDEQHQLTERWLQVWASLCALSSLLTVGTFLLERGRFPYPQRPVVFMAGCYLLVAVGYLVRAFAGREMTACQEGLLRQDAGGELGSSVLCTAVFVLIYFFGMASAAWWVVLALTWFLAAGLKWGNEVIAGYSPYFHLAGWVPPAALAIAALASDAVDGDPLTGVCYVGGHSLAHQRWFVLAPLAAGLLLGMSFLLAGFVALCRVRGVLKQHRGAQDRLERLMMRIGVFSVLYTVPAALVIASLVYEQYRRSDWESALVCPCRKAPVVPTAVPVPGTALTAAAAAAAIAAAAEKSSPGADESTGYEDIPSYELLLLRFIMSLAVGVT
ncbi:Frizzled-5 [Amphibalanus amphitrite]|uniref:Frizzled-5 n=2 Tax=Amphibalanus amphitrite TaxID=1232801 RepID=A0A6A4W0L2_AMPAM|nr:Frizzled-5 [Amphibalanus amphitrite]